MPAPHPATRLPVQQQQHIPLPYPADAGVRSMPRMCSVATVRAAWGPLRVMTTHLEFYSKRQRMAQAHALVDIHAQACRQAPHAPTFRLHDKRDGPVPISCDFVLVSEALSCRVQRVSVNTQTKASDHQPVLVELN